MSIIRPLPGFVLVEPIEDEVKTSGGLWVPENNKDKPSRGKVLAIGKPIKLRKDNEWNFVEGSWSSPVKLNDIVVYKKFTNQEIEEDGKKYLLIPFDQLLAIIE